MAANFGHDGRRVSSSARPRTTLLASSKKLLSEEDLGLQATPPQTIPWNTLETGWALQHIQKRPAGLPTGAPDVTGGKPEAAPMSAMAPSPRTLTSPRARGAPSGVNAPLLVPDTIPDLNLRPSRSPRSSTTSQPALGAALPVPSLSVPGGLDGATSSQGGFGGTLMGTYLGPRAGANQGLENAEQAVLAAALRNENELLRLQLNDIIIRERTQRVELQRLREARDQEAALLAREAGAEQAHDIEQLSQLLSKANDELQKVTVEKRQLEQVLEEQVLESRANEGQAEGRLQVDNDLLSSAAATCARLADSVEAFQQHVLPNFKPPPGAKLSPVDSSGLVEGDEHGIMKELVRLERGLNLLRMVVDAKNDTLVLIRGRLKQENEQLKVELQEVLGQKSEGERAILSTEDNYRQEKGALRQELHSLQGLYNEELQQLRQRLESYEAKEDEEQGRASAVLRQVTQSQARISALEEANQKLQDVLKEESAAREQLVQQLARQRKDSEVTRTELETLKLSQKFLVRMPRGGARIPPEKMNLMNMLNQLLQETNRLKAEKISLEEELKLQRRAQIRERVQSTLTQRDVALAASDKVRDSELAQKLARQRLEALVSASDGDTPTSTRSAPTTTMLGTGLCSSPYLSTAAAASLLGSTSPPERDTNVRQPLAAQRQARSMKGVGSWSGGSGPSEIKNRSVCPGGLEKEAGESIPWKSARDIQWTGNGLPSPAASFGGFDWEIQSGR